METSSAGDPGAPWSAIAETSAATPGAVVRRSNTALIVGLLRSRGPSTRAELVRASGLARPTVMAIVTALVQAGVVLESGTRRPADLPSPRGGRPGTLLSFNGAVATVVGAQLHRGGVTMRQVTADGRTVLESLVGTSATGVQEVGDVLAAEVERFADTANPPAAIGLSLPGLLDHGRVTLPGAGWYDEPLQDILQARTGIPVALMSPATAATAGERSAGVARDHDDVVLVHSARGIAAGVLAGGRLLRGSGGAFGELGHCPVGADATCRCGRRGCLETVAGEWAVRDRLAALGLTVSTAENLADLDRRADPRVDAVTADAARALGTATAWMVNLLNPSLVVLADTPLTRGAGRFRDVFAEAVLEHSVSTVGLDVVGGTEDAVLLGAVQAALELLPSPVRPELVLGR